MHCKIEPSFCFHHHMFCCKMTISPTRYILEDLKITFSVALSAYKNVLYDITYIAVCINRA